MHKIERGPRCHQGPQVADARDQQDVLTLFDEMGIVGGAEC